MKLSQCEKFYIDDDGCIYTRLSSITKLAEYSQDGLLYAGASMVAKRVPELVQCAIEGRKFPRPTVVQGEPATVDQDLRNWPNMVKWLSDSPAAEMAKARNRGHIIDDMAVYFAKYGPLSIKDAGEWAVQRGIDSQMMFDQDNVYRRACCLAAWWGHVNPTPIAWQVQTYSPKLGVCGTFDMIVKIDGVYYLIDWKAGSYNPVYKMQVCSYRLFPNVYHENEETAQAILKIKRRCTPALVCIGDDRVQFRPILEARKWHRGLTNTVAMYRCLNAPEDSPVLGRLSYTMDHFDKAEAGI